MSGLMLFGACLGCFLIGVAWLELETDRGDD